MKKIAYIEIDTHAEIAQAFMEIMKGSEAFSVDYYFSKKIKDQITEKNESVFLSESSMILDQLKGKGYNLVIIGTAHRYFNTFLSVAQKYNTAIIAHNLNFVKASKLRLIRNIFKGDLVYRLKLLWKEGLTEVPELHQKARHLMVLDEGLVSGQFQNLPLFFTKDFSKTENDHPVIVIPGGVSQKRRDYQHIFKIIRKIQAPGKYTFVFLGKAKGQELKTLEVLSQELPQNIKIQYFSKRVSAKEFHEWMQKADVLWCPVQKETTFFSQKERYGHTKMTGNLGDAIKYGKLAVFPSNYPTKNQFIIPEREDVIEQFGELKNLIYDFQENYSKEAVQSKLEAVLQSLITI